MDPLYSGSDKVSSDISQLDESATNYVFTWSAGKCAMLVVTGHMARVVDVVHVWLCSLMVFPRDATLKGACLTSEVFTPRSCAIQTPDTPPADLAQVSRAKDRFTSP